MSHSLAQSMKARHSRAWSNPSTLEAKAGDQECEITLASYKDPVFKGCGVGMGWR